MRLPVFSKTLENVRLMIKVDPPLREGHFEGDGWLILETRFPVCF